MIHVRFEGRSWELNEKDLDLPPRPHRDHILDQVARRLGVSRRRLEDYVVDRRPSGAVVVRPEAVYG